MEERLVVVKSETDDVVTIGELARSLGVSTRTIRYYEELGILPPPPRTPLGTRFYPPAWRFYLEGALALKGLGFKLDEIALVGRLALGESITVEQRAEALQLVADNMKVLEHRIRVLRAIKRRFSESTTVAGGIGAVIGEAGGTMPS